MHYNRIRRWSHANNLTVGNATHVGQNTEYVESVMADWREVVKEKISDNEYADDCIVNMDETNVPFEAHVTKTLDKVVVRLYPSRQQERLTDAPCCSRVQRVIGSCLHALYSMRVPGDDDAPEDVEDTDDEE